MKEEWNNRCLYKIAPRALDTAPGLKLRRSFLVGNTMLPHIWDEQESRQGIISVVVVVALVMVVV